MTHTRSHVLITRTVAATLALMAGSAGTLAAQGRSLFAFSGRVDREVLLVMRGGNVDTRKSSRDDYGQVRVGSQLPQRDGTVRLRVERGRGSADVVQQPSARNDYTAVIRLRDDQAGADEYRVSAYWQGDGTYAGNDDGRSDDGRYDRGNDRGGNNGRGGGWGRGGRNQNDDGQRDRAQRRGRDDDRDDRDGQNGDWDRDGRTDDGRTRNGNSPWDIIRGRAGNSGGGSGVLRWSGRVDDVEEIRIQGRRVDSYAVSGGGASGVRSNVSGGLPARDVYVQVHQLDGRGRVRVVEQPSARNGYTAVLRIEDRDGGAGFYNIEASW